MSAPACPSCGAVSSGNLTCLECRAEIRKRNPSLSEFLDRLDAAGIETVPPVGHDITAASNSLKDKAITSSFGAGNRAKVRSSVTPRYTGGAA